MTGSWSPSAALGCGAARAIAAKPPNYPVERTAGSHRVAAAAHRSVEFMHNDDKDHPTRWPAGELRKVNPSSIMRLSVIPEGDPRVGRPGQPRQWRRTS